MGHSFRTRIEWCERLRKMAVTREEEEGWQAEEAGLLDAFLGIDRTELTTNCHPHRLNRYQLGLRDGRTVMRMSL